MKHPEKSLKYFLPLRLLCIKSIIELTTRTSHNKSLTHLLLQQLYSICSNFILFAATLFYLQQRFLICSNFILFAARPLWATVEKGVPGVVIFSPLNVVGLALISQKGLRSDQVYKLQVQDQYRNCCNHTHF